MASVLVTGGTGQIGAAVTRRFVREGHHVVALDLAPNYPNVADIATDCRIVAGDITDREMVARTIREQGVSHIVHLAGITYVQSRQDPDLAVRVNMAGTVGLFETARAGDVERVCYASSANVYGHGHRYGAQLLTEQEPPIPATIYGSIKRAIEIIAETYRSDLGLETVGIRPTFTYGPGRMDGGAGAFNVAIRDAARHGKAVLRLLVHAGGREARFQPIYTEDIAALALAATLNASVPSPVYNAQVTGWHTVGDFIAALEDVIPGLEIDVDRSNEPSGAATGVMLDGSLATRELGVVQRYSLPDALAEMVTRYRSETQGPTR